MDLQVQVAHPHLVLRQIVRQIFRHPLGQRRHQHPLVLAARCRISPSRSSTCPVVGRTSTTGSRTPVGRITCSATSPTLTSISQSPGVAETNTVWLAFSQNSSPFNGRLSAALGKRKPCSIKDLLAGLITVVHRLQLGTSDVTLIHDQQPVVWKVIDQALRRGALLAASQMAGVVLHPVAVTNLTQHLQVVLGALLQALGLKQLAFSVEHIQTLPQL